MQYMGHDQHGVAYYLKDADVYSVAGDSFTRECTYAGWGCRQVVHKLDVRELVTVELETSGGYFAPISKAIPAERAALLALDAYKSNRRNRRVRIVNSVTGEAQHTIEVS